MDLARQPGALLYGRARDVRVPQDHQLRVRAPQGAHLFAALDRQPGQQDHVEDHALQVAQRDDGAVDTGVDRELDLAECGHDQTDGQERIQALLLTPEALIGQGCRTQETDADQHLDPQQQPGTKDHQGNGRVGPQRGHLGRTQEPGQ